MGLCDIFQVHKSMIFIFILVFVYCECEWVWVAWNVVFLWDLLHFLGLTRNPGLHQIICKVQLKYVNLKSEEEEEIAEHGIWVALKQILFE